MSNVLCKIAMLLLVVAFPFGAMAQHNHSTGHDVYMEESARSGLLQR